MFAPAGAKLNFQNVLRFLILTNDLANLKIEIFLRASKTINTPLPEVIHSLATNVMYINSLG